MAVVEPKGQYERGDIEHSMIEFSNFGVLSTRYRAKMTSRPRFQIDFNEMYSPSVVALSRGDVRNDVNGNPVRLEQGMIVEVCEDDIDDNDAPDLLIGVGTVIPRPEDLVFAISVKWWCEMKPPGPRHQSEIDRTD